MTALYVMLTATLGLSGAVMLGLTLLYRAPMGQALHIRESKGRPISDAQFRRYALINGLLSLALVYGLTFALQNLVFQAGTVTPLRALLEGLAVLLVYDFGYYFVHRYPFHEWTLLRRVHAVHHVVKNPTAIDSLYLHPLENVIGLALLWLSALVVALISGPISVYAFGWSFCLYSLLNVAIHSGLQFRSFPLRLITHLGVRHYRHHTGMRAKNYASVTPIFDILFHTEEA